jgi:hypothetical protein
MTRYRLLKPIPAIYDKPDGRLVRVNLPVGALLLESPQSSGTLIGMIGVTWEGRHYSVQSRDLLQDAERIKTA